MKQLKEITFTEMLELARFIYDEPDRDGIPLLDIGIKIYQINSKIKVGIETSKVACKKIRRYNTEIPCTPIHKDVFWAKLKGIKPLEFLNPVFNPAVSVEDVIKFSVAEKNDIDALWAKYAPLMERLEQQQKNSIINTEPTPTEAIMSSKMPPITQHVIVSNNGYGSLDDLFFDPKEIGNCLRALSLTKPRIVDDKMNYVLSLRKKSAIAVWVKVLKDKHRIKDVDDSQLAYLLNGKINNLNMGLNGKTLRAISQTAISKFEKQLIDLIT